MMTTAAHPSPYAAHELPPTGNTELTRPENRAFFPALDGLRALAFLMVFGQHYLSLAWGWTGVNIFFVLSGFLITGILYDTRDDPFRVRNFYVRRTLRIFPLYYGIFLGLLLLTPVLHWQWDRYWALWPLYLGNFLRFVSPAVLQGGSALERAADAHLGSARLPHSELYLGHFWSLCVEEQYYLLFPWVVFWIRDRKRLMWLCLAFVVLAPLFRVALSLTAPAWMLKAELLYRFTPAQFDSLMLGGLCALLWRGHHRAQLQAAARWLALAGTLIVVLYFVFGVRTWKLDTPQYPHWIFTGGLLFADWYAAALIVCALSPGGVVYRLFHVRALRWIGRLSYGAYVFHDLAHNLYAHVVLHLVGESLRARPMIWRGCTALLALPCTLVLAYLSFRFFETPFLNLKERWTVRPAAAAPASSLGATT